MHRVLWFLAGALATAGAVVVAAEVAYRREPPYLRRWGVDMALGYSFQPEKACQGKRAYPSRAVARRVVRLLQSKIGGSRMEVYRCRWCASAFHIGHAGPRRVV